MARAAARRRAPGRGGAERRRGDGRGEGIFGPRCADGRHMKLIFCPDHKIPMQLRDDGQLMDSSTGEVKKYWYSCLHYPARCEYSIGAHQNTREPFGFPADRATRALRVKLHQLIDPLWKHRG